MENEVEFDAFENAAENPALLEAAARMTADEEMPKPEAPLDGPVTLVAGYRQTKISDGRPSLVEVTRAWVRELNGADEERIARAKMKDDSNAWLTAILSAGVERLGDETATKDDLDMLVIGDRDFLLMEIARATYGNEIEYDEVECPHCGGKVGVSLTFDDIPVKRLDSPDETTFEVPLKNGRVATVNLPTHELTGLLISAQTEAEANTILIANCVEEIRRPNGFSEHLGGDKDAALRLSIPDRRKLISEMSERMPGPQYNGVRFNHDVDGCGEEIRLPITLADLFRGL